ncbi:MerR family transcriptional regulator [Umezawaea beigongshangensis]|uniref:MerR family transcriptional regulator n=1 Tax=Umezawaea beigongshangensis TaxID=2780383 RepID=UPI0018F1A69C|nr:MerR family transcriptional regulator [Umezawaea beigongshangensis]
MLTIGELARLAATTVRAVRHYHAEGLLEEPERDHSGYRRYGANDLIRLVRIRRLREVGVPLARIGELLVDRELLGQVIDDLDAELAERQRVLAEQRARLAELRALRADPELPEAAAGVFAELAAAGVSQRVLEQERDALLLVSAIDPATTAVLVERYRTMVTAPGGGVGVELAKRFDALREVPADDPAVALLAAEIAEFTRQQVHDLVELAGERPDPKHVAERVMADWLGTMSPAQRRVVELMGAEF